MNDGVARDHQEPAQLGQRGDDVLADAVGEILLLRIAAHVDEGQHGDGRPVGQRQGRARLVLAVIRRRIGGAGRRHVRWPDAVRLGAHGADETQALAWDGADQALAFAAVADRVACRVDAAGQRRVRHDAAAPDRGDEVVLADHAVAVVQQVNQQVEYLRLNRDASGTAAQLAPVGVKRVIGEAELHVGAPTTERRSGSRGIITLISRINQAAGKVFRSGRRHPSDIVTAVIVPDRSRP